MNTSPAAASSERYHSTNPGSPTNPQSDLDREYVYDPIGNRKRYREGDDPNLYYCANSLNQYTDTTLTAPPNNCPPSSPVESFAYDTDGNLTGDGGKVPGASRPEGTPRKFTWDAENRLVRVEPADGYSPVAGDVKVEFRYDYMGRRVEKKVSTHDGSSWTVTNTRRFIWYNWLMLLELNGSNEVLKKYTWGLDLAGLSGQVNSLESAGGIGGLLACYDTAGTSTTGDDKSYAYMFDANGNVGQLVDVSDGSMDAHYEYDAYGNAVVAIGSYAQSNALRFSTKYWDAETTFGYWGHRYLASDCAQWASRDPIEERDGPHLYAFVHNRPSLEIDSTGMNCCGVDVTDELTFLITNLERTFKGWHPSTMACVCMGIWDLKGWDIEMMHEGGSASGPHWFSPPQSPGCGTGNCKGTLQLFGNCYLAGEVNYIWWGRLNRLCHDYFDRWTEKVYTWPSTIYFSRCGDYREQVEPDRYTLRKIQGIVGWYRWGLGWLGEAAPAGKGTTRCRKLWTEIGWDGAWEIPLDECRSECPTRCCTDKLARPLKGQAAQEEISSR